MKRLPGDARDEDILDAVREWVALLAEERYDDASAFLAHDSVGGREWTAERIATTIRIYGSPEPWPDGQIFRVTSPEAATGPLRPSHDIGRHGSAKPDERSVGYVWFDLPLNGGWSDLTAMFDILADGDDIVLQLDDIHVM